MLVTGVPRSGTTWVARQLAGASGAALPGREPMNPRGRQYALGATLTGWSRLTRVTPRQRRALVSCYAGVNAKTFSRYGIRQWAAPLPGTRVVVKDPFAVLSVRTIHEVTGAIPVLVYRHPAAVLASYRRMGWGADYDEVSALPDFVAASPDPVPGVDDEVREMAEFWRFCNLTALRDLDEIGVGVVVAHAEVAAGGDASLRRLGQAVGLRIAATPGDSPARTGAAPAPRPDAAAEARVLHDFHRDPAGVAEEWRRWVAADEVAQMESIGGDVLAMLEERRLSFLPERKGTAS